MWSGLLPAGVSDDDIDEEEPGATIQNEGPQTEPIPSQCAEAEHPLGESGACPAGVSPNQWHKFQELQKKNIEIKSQANFQVRGRRRKRRRKGVTDKLEESQTGGCESQPSKDDAPMEELKQFFGINDRFEPPVTNKILQKSGLEVSIDRAVDGGDIEKAEELSDQLATREMGVKIAKAVGCREFIKARREDLASQEAQRKKKKLAWGFEAKQRWETKSNMGYM
ncbi:protein FAM204A [Lissotriton helveticus]